MAGVASNASRATMMAQVLNKTAASNLTLRLYKNNVTPSDTDPDLASSTYTEANFTGYSAASFTAANWSVTTAKPAVASYAQQTFTSSADQSVQNVYGYYITNAAGSLVVAELFSDGPYAVSANGQTIKVTPTISLTD